MKTLIRELQQLMNFSDWIIKHHIIDNKIDLLKTQSPNSPKT